MSTVLSFGSWVGQRRRVLRLKQHELAQQVGYSLVLIRKIEADERRPSAELAERLARALQIPPDDVPAFIRVSRGERAVFHLPQPDWAIASFSRPAQPAVLVVHHLPAPLTQLIGRQESLDLITNLVEQDQARLVTLTGPPGIGKTSLALAAAYILLPGYPDGAYFVDLAPVREAALVLPAVAQALGIQERGETALASATRYLRHRRVLLVLDNLEQVVECATEIAELLANAPSLLVLATSRAPLRLRGEHLVSVPPLALQDAVELFLQRARALEAPYATTRDETTIMETIVGRLDGLPLAIELAAARARLFTPVELLARLDQRLALLTAGPRDAPLRHQTLAQAIGWSYELLSPAEQALFRWLGVFAGGFTVEAAATVATSMPGSGQHFADEVVEYLEVLLDQSLLTHEGMRFGMLESLREFALAQLAAAGELVEARAAHAAYMLALVEHAEAAEHTTRERALFDQLEEERGNLRAALAWSCEDASHPDLGVRLGRALAAFWQRRGSQREGCNWMKRIATRQGQTPRLRAQFFGRVMWLTDLDEELDWAEHCAREGLAIYQALGDEAGIALLLGNLGTIAERRGRYQEALSHFRSSEKIYRTIGTRRELAMVTFWIGETLLLQGDLEHAQRLLDESLQHGRAIGSRLITSRRLALLALVYIETGHPAAARERLSEGLAIARQDENRFELAVLFTGYAGLLITTGRYDDAARLLGASDQLLETIGVRYDATRDRVYRACMATLSAALGEPALQGVLNAGRALTIDQAVALAQE